MRRIWWLSSTERVGNKNSRRCESRCVEKQAKRRWMDTPVGLLIQESSFWGGSYHYSSVLFATTYSFLCTKYSLLSLFETGLWVSQTYSFQSCKSRRRIAINCHHSPARIMDLLWATTTFHTDDTVTIAVARENKQNSQ